MRKWRECHRSQGKKMIPQWLNFSVFFILISWKTSSKQRQKNSFWFTARSQFSRNCLNMKLNVSVFTLNVLIIQCFDVHTVFFTHLNYFKQDIKNIKTSSSRTQNLLWTHKSKIGIKKLEPAYLDAKLNYAIH